MKPPRKAYAAALQSLAPHGQAVRFVLVGVLNTLVGYGAFFFLLYFFSYLPSLFGSYAVGVANSFLWNKFWTFRARGRLGELARFVSVYLLTLAFNAAALYALVGLLALDPRAGQVAIMPVATLMSYLGHKYWSFNVR